MTDPEAGLHEAAETADPEPPPIELTEATLEALLFVAERPLTRDEIATVARVERDVVDARLGDLEVTLRDRGLRLVADGEQVALATAPEAGLLIARFVGADEAPRLTPAALETLSIVAYGQPITRSGIERIRGVDAEYALRVLMHRRLVVELGRSEAAGRPILYGTGMDFLERFGLTSIQDLPPLEVETASRLNDAAGTGEAAASAPDPRPGGA